MNLWVPMGNTQARIAPEEEVTPLVRNPTPKPSVLCYKQCKFSVFDASVVLWIQVDVGPDKVFFSETPARGALTTVNDLNTHDKFCTSHGRVLGAQFLGSPVDFKRVLDAYLARKCSIVSHFDETFVYEVNAEVFEDAAGTLGRGGCCKGIHFFTNADRAVEYRGRKLYNSYWPILTRRLPDRLELVNVEESRIEAPPAAESKIEAGEPALAPGHELMDPSMWFQSDLAPPRRQFSYQPARGFVFDNVTVGVVSQRAFDQVFDTPVEPRLRRTGPRAFSAHGEGQI